MLCGLFQILIHGGDRLPASFYTYLSLHMNFQVFWVLGTGTPSLSLGVSCVHLLTSTQLNPENANPTGLAFLVFCPVHGCCLGFPRSWILSLLSSVALPGSTWALCTEPGNSLSTVSETRSVGFVCFVCLGSHSSPV